MFRIVSTKIAALFVFAFVINSVSLGDDHQTDTIKNSPFIPEEDFLLSQVIASPSGTIDLNVELSVDSVLYSVAMDQNIVINSSGLDLNLTNGLLVSGVTLDSTSLNQIDEVLLLPHGERSTVHNLCSEFTMYLKNSLEVRFALQFRVYDYGVGFRFMFPGNNSVSSVWVQDEHTNFAIQDGYRAYREPYNEQGYTYSALNGLQSLIPLTLIGPDYSLVINEAANDNYARVGLKGRENNLYTYFLGGRSAHALPHNIPWRYVTIGERPHELLENKEMLYALNNHDYNESEWDWVKPGTVFRCLNLTTEGALESLDFCDDMDISYMMFDAGWYGLGYGQANEHNSASNPLEVIDELDMEVVSNYAEEKGIGLILYVNKVAWNNYDNQAMFDLYESWGIKGVKLGFMDGYSSNGIKKIHEIIEEAALRQMVVNVHDNFRPTGMVRKYPNLLTAEGVRGNEYVTNTGAHTTLVPYTRMMTGVTDYTICHVGNDPDYESKLLSNATSKGHQLALGIIMFSPLQHVMWYGRPHIFSVPLETELFRILPTSWDDFKFVAGEPGNYFSMARKKGDDWFLATISNNNERNVSVPLNFLESNRDYEVVIYRDAAPETTEKTVTTLDDLEQAGILTSEGLYTSLWENGGEVVLFRALDFNRLSKKQDDSQQSLMIFPNPGEKNISVKCASFKGRKGEISIFSLNGTRVFNRIFSSLNDSENVDVSSFDQGAYVVVLEIDEEQLSGKFLVKK